MEAFDDSFWMLNEAGAIDEWAMDENGELMVSWNMAVLEEKFPEVKKQVEEISECELRAELDKLTEEGLIEVSFKETENGLEDVYRITEKGKQFLGEL